MLGFIILLVIFVIVWAGLISLADVEEVRKNWPQNRCKPSVMPFAAFYGYSTAENFNFCIQNMMGSEMGAALGPLFVILGSIVSSMMTLIQVANSIRVQFATMMGGINTLFQNFADRFNQLLSAVSMTGYRMKLIFGRLYGAFFAMIYMSISGMASLQNFTQSVLFDFLDTFCFDPDTLVHIEEKGLIPIKDVKIGDIFVKTKGRVTATFKFEADGQQMVMLPGNIVVSTNHYVNYLGKWIMAADHPEAKPAPRWSGGKERPLICLNTTDHKLPVGHYMFLDYDETEEGDIETMAYVEKSVNGSLTDSKRGYVYNTCVDRETQIKIKDGSLKSIETIQLGDQLSTGKVIGIIQKQTDQYCHTYTNECVTPGLLFWQTKQWIRAGDVFPIITLQHPQTFYNLVVMSSAKFETKKGLMMRDYVEVHSPETEKFYSKCVKAQ